MRKTNSSKKTGSSVKKSPKSERLIFRYWDGTKERAADPLEIQHALTSIDGFDLEIDSKLAGGTSSEAPRALHRLVDAVRRAFDVSPYRNDAGRETGLTSAECITLLLEFASFIDDLKKKLGISPTTSNVTEQGSSTESSQPKSESDSPSTGTESSADAA